MKGFLLIILFLFSSCQENTNHTDFIPLKLIKIEPANFKIDFIEKTEILLTFNNKLKSKPKIFFIESPKSEVLAIDSQKSLVALKITAKEFGQKWLITSKNQLNPGSIYGVYLKLPSDSLAKLVHSFYLKRKKPILESHTLFDDNNQAVFVNRKIIDLKFDQEIKVSPEKITLREDGVIISAWENIVLRSDKKNLELILLPNVLQNNKKYSLELFDALENLDNVKSSIEPIHFNVWAKSEALSIIKPTKIAFSHNSLEVILGLNNAHRSEVFYGEKLDLQDCLNNDCHKFYLSTKNDKIYESKVYINSLKSDIFYNVIINAIDWQDDSVKLAANFKSLSPTLLISEIMINPEIKKGQKENEAEFIKIFNYSDKPILLNEMTISIESIDGASFKACDLRKEEENYFLAPKSFAVIVGNKFSPKFSDNTLIFRLKSNSICGGFSNQRKSIITLWKNKENYYDRYSAHLRPAKEGHSIKKLDIMGLDEESNYCYQSHLD